MRNFYGNLFTFFMVAYPCFYFGRLIEIASHNGGLPPMNFEEWTLFCVSTFLLTCGIVSVFNVPIRGWRIKLIVTQEEPPKSSWGSKGPF